MTSATSVKVWAVVATLALLIVQEVSPSQIEADPCSQPVPLECINCFAKEPQIGQKTCSLEWYYEANGHTCYKHTYHELCDGITDRFDKLAQCMKACDNLDIKRWISGGDSPVV